MAANVRSVEACGELDSISRSIELVRRAMIRVIISSPIGGRQLATVASPALLDNRLGLLRRKEGLELGKVVTEQQQVALSVFEVLAQNAIAWAPLKGRFGFLKSHANL